MNKLSVFVLLAITTIFLNLGCGPADDTPGVDCSPIDVGALNFAENTKAWYPYAGPEVLVFKNEAGDTIRFRRDEPFDSIFTFRYDREYKLQRGGCPDSLLVRYDYPTKIGLFESDSLEFTIFADIRVSHIWGLSPPAFYEELRIIISQKTGPNSSRSITSIHFITDNKEQLCPIRPLQCREPEFLESITLLDKTYENVYHGGLYHDGDIYYHQTIGVLGFGDSSTDFWVLVGVG